MKCKNCGAKIDSADRFCRLCGYSNEKNSRHQSENSAGSCNRGKFVVAVLVIILLISAALLLRWRWGSGDTENLPLYTESDEAEMVSEAQNNEEPLTEIELLGAVSVSTNDACEDSTVYGNDTSYSDLSLENKIDYIRDWYYTTQDAMDDLEVVYGEDGCVTSYYDGDDCVRVTVKSGYFDSAEYPGADRLSSEYYYHNGLLYFVFLHYYDEEYRYYLEYREGDICCIRYIDQTGTSWDYYEKMLLLDLGVGTSALCNAGNDQNPVF